MDQNTNLPISQNQSLDPANIQPNVQIDSLYDISPDNVPNSKWDELVNTGGELVKRGSEVLTPPGTTINQQSITNITEIAQPGGSNQQIQFNDGGVFAGNGNMTFDKNAGGDLILRATDHTTGTGGDLILTSGDTNGSAGVGGNINIEAGDSIGSGSTGGSLRLWAGDGTADGGAISIRSGSGAGEEGTGGEIEIAAGSSGDVSGPNVEISAGGADEGDNNGGEVIIISGYGSGTGSGGNIQLIPGDGGTGPQGDVFINGTVATNSGGGFLVVPKCAGVPTGTPVEGSIVLDTTGDKLYVYSSGSWRALN